MTAHQILLPADPELLGFNVDLFQDWQDGQAELIQRILDWYLTSPNKFLFLEAPTGWGKSLVAGAVARAISDHHSILGSDPMTFRTTICTSTINLQQQYINETLPGLAESAWGRGQHDCLIIPNTKANEAPCTVGFDCDQMSVCGYYVQRDAAVKAPIRILNTAYYLTSINRAYLPRDKRTARAQHFFEGTNLVIYDEADGLERQIQSFVEGFLNRKFFEDRLKVKLPNFHEYGQWKDFIDEHYAAVNDYARIYEASARKLAHEGKKPRDPTGRMAVVAREQMTLILRELLPIRPLIEHKKAGVSFRPVWGRDFADEYCFSKADRHILMSATLGDPKYLADTLGINPDSYSHIALPSPFLPNRRRIIYEPVIRVNAKTTPREFLILVQRMDELIDEHCSGVRGIIHAVSYRRAQDIYKMSRHRSRMVMHESGRQAKRVAIETYLARDDAILVSPAVGLGEDFGRQDGCRFQFFVKYPIPNLGDPVVRARTDENPDSLWAEADKAFVQAVGRGMRSRDDWCVNFLLDAGAGWRLERLPAHIQESIVRL